VYPNARGGGYGEKGFNTQDPQKREDRQVRNQEACEETSKRCVWLKLYLLTRKLLLELDAARM